MGQGIMTGLAQCAAEELMVDWSQVRTAAAPWSETYITGGSYGVRANMQAMRLAGAKARDMLKAAAAARWGVDVSTVTVTSGVIKNASNATLTYADVASDAALLTAPASPTLTDPANFRIIGTRAKRTDLPSKVDGTAVFGLDVQVPGMVYAAVRMSPVIGGTLTTLPAKPATAMAVLNLGNAVAVVAKDSWIPLDYCSIGISSTSSTWRDGIKWTAPAGASAITSATILTTAQTLMTSGTPAIPPGGNVGTAAANYAAAPKKFEGTYQLPFLPHVMMEVPNCTVSLTATTAEVWVPTQAAGWVASTVSSLTGIPVANVTVHPTLLGGGFGRKIETDYVVHAVKIAKAIGKPVKVFWPRGEDLSHDQYRPMGLIRVRFGMDADGAPTSYQVRHVSPSPLFQRGWIAANGVDNVDGAVDVAYGVPNRLVEYVRHTTTAPVGFWRSVGESMNCFAVESAVDEAAAVAGIDPVQFRRNMLAGKPRHLAVLNAAASMIGWDTAPAAGHSCGLAFTNGFGSIACLALEISQPVAGSITVHRAAIAVDCGLAVNKTQIEAQMQGGIIQGLTSALWGKTTFASGKASTSNFNNVRLLKMSETPAISVQIIESGIGNLGGVGEVAVPPVAPALANAYFRLTGTRQRALPFF
jgi:isoquinoline 1-oxidoreductase beta subunit